MRAIHLVSKREPRPLSIGEARDVAKRAYTHAKAAHLQRALIRVVEG